MRKIIFILFLFVSIFSYSQRINQDIEITNMKLYDVLAILSKETGRSLVASQDSKNIIIDNYFSEGENLENIISILAEENNLSISKVNGITLFSLASEKIKNKSKIVGKIVDEQNNPVSNARLEIKNSNFYPTFTDKNGNFIIDDITKGAYILKISKNNFETRGEIINLNKNIFVFNSVLKNKENLKIKNNLESENNFENNFFEIDGKLLYSKNFSLNYISPKDVEDVLRNSFGENIKVNLIPKTNKIILIAERDILESASKIIKDIDKNAKQVKITSQILDISNSLFEELGFNWFLEKGNKANGSSKDSLTAGILTKSVAVAGGNLFGSSLNIIRQFHHKNDILSFEINLLEANNDLVVSSMPSITIANEEEGEFKVTEEVIVGERRQRNYRKNNKDNENYDNRYTAEPIFKEAGLILKVKPTIKEDDYIFLEISIELSDFKFKRNLLNVSEINSGTFNSEGGSKIGRSLKTKVRVKNGDTILIGGLKKSIKQNLESKIPLLGDIPLINFFFKNISKKIENSDMYIKIKVDIEE
ncbi:MAG: carboxypeptidase regulatory-like domain-containing protein [Fusobacterium sp.]|nr:carboxypeptidase regulatory-like domain-containing protein [Fusobacterium sp.]